MNSGKVFENDWKKSINREEIYYLRLKDSPSSFGQDSSFTRFTANNPYDALCFYSGCLFPMELKHTKNTSFSFQRDKRDKGKMIKLTQINGLLDANKYGSVYAGFVFNIINEEKNSNKCYWLDIDNFKNFYDTTSKVSINENDIISNGGILIENSIKKIHYTYNVKLLLNEIVERKEKE